MIDITLEGISKKGKQRIKQYGNEWKLSELSKTVGFSNKPGPWLKVEIEGYSRWIHKESDEDFKVLNIKE